MSPPDTGQSESDTALARAVSLIGGDGDACLEDVAERRARRSSRAGPTAISQYLAPYAAAAALSCAVVQAQSAQAELRAAEEQLAAALIAKDAAAFQRMIAPDFVLRGTPDVNRAAWIENARKLCWGDRFDISDFRIVGEPLETAIVTLVLTTNRDPSTCEPAKVGSLLTDVWRREDDQWRLVLRHTGPVGSAVDVQFAKTAPPPPVFEGTAELSLVSTGGNSDTESLGLGSSVTWRPQRWTSDARLAFVRSEASDVETARSLFASIRQGRTLTTRLDAFARAEYLVNQFAGIDDRVSIDAGLGWKAIDTHTHRLRLDSGFGYSREHRLTGADRRTALANIAGVYRWQRREAISIENASLFTASLERSADWRVRNTLALTVAMSRRLSVKLGHDLEYVNAPPAGFGEADRTLSAALVAKF